MEKGKLLGAILGLVLGLAVLVTPAYAMVPVVHITQLPEYTTTNGFKLSYSALSDNPAAISAQFSVQKDGGIWNSFGAALPGANGQIQVTDVQMPSDANYCFKVVISGDEDQTCTTYDSAAPGNVANYSKGQVSPSTMRIYWTNPSISDFDVVYIYRGEQPDFTADEAHKVTGIGGTPGADMTYDDSGLDLANKTYYYALRAFDKAGNGSGLIGDNQVTTVLGAQTTPAGTKVTTLPKEQTVGGEVLSGSTEPTPTTAIQGVVNQIAESVKAVNKTRIIGIVIGVLLLGLAAFFLFKKRSQ
jgi:hypothetical protein